MYRRRTSPWRLIGIGLALLGVLAVMLSLIPRNDTAVGGHSAAATAADPSPSPEAGPVATPTATVPFPPGTRVRTTEAVNLRSAPGLKGVVLATVAQGAELVVLEGPQDLDNYHWWKVQTRDTPPREGWMADNWWTPIAGTLEAGGAGAG